jgi:HB1, ASXL, restriction endonuclease HTH domain
MAKKITKKTTQKKTAKKASSKKPRMSASAARAEGAAKQKAIREGNSKPATPRKAKEAKPKRVSLLDAAATVLASAKEPMQAKAIVEAVLKRGLWKPGAGKTPHATLYAAMTREITAKGKDARFRKVERGMFTGA